MRHSLSYSRTSSGFTLIEVVLVIVVAGILAGVAMRGSKQIAESARSEETKQELEALSNAIIGNSSLENSGSQPDFGYVGDVGSLPPNLDALVTNPGGYSTWNGPYIQNRFSQTTDDYKRDAWNSFYGYSGGVTITSTGSGSNIIRNLAPSTDDLLMNNVSGLILDVDGTPPGNILKDSLSLRFMYPDGTGNISTKSISPDAGGYFSFDSIPIGNQDIYVIYAPSSDTVRRYVSVLANSSSYLEFRMPASFAGSASGSPEILRPMGIGFSSELSISGCTSNWECVDDIVADEQSSTVKGSGGGWRSDTYATENSSVNSGTIDSVLIFVRAKGGGGLTARVALRTNGSFYEGADITLTSGFADYSITYVTNPNTTSQWSWAEINSMEIGVSFLGAGKATQIWAEVYFTP